MSSHASAPVTTSLLTILCVALVHRDRPDWLAIGVGDAARAAALSPERVSRLAFRVARPFADVVASITRRGRPARIEDPVRAELITLRALLTVAAAALALVPLRGPAVGALLVGAWLRLSTELPSLTKGAFCKALSLPITTASPGRRRQAIAQRGSRLGGRSDTYFAGAQCPFANAPPCAGNTHFSPVSQLGPQVVT
jgi:hypothetical protein